MMTKVALLPYINRNLHQVLDHNGSGLIAYGCRTSIYVLDFRTSPPVVLDSRIICNSHQGKVLSVSFCKSSNEEFLASIGEEGLVKIWDLESSTCITSLEVNECSRVVEWLYSSKNSVVFPDFHGSVIKWNFRNNKVVRMKTSSDTTCSVLSSNKNLPELLAVGHSAGSISILNVNKQVLLHKLKTHSMEITSLSWSPISPEMLLSTSMDQSARLWKLGEDKPFNTYYYPTSRNKIVDKKILKFCGICHPVNPDIIICSNVRGDLGAVTFKENESPKFTAYSTKDFDSNFKMINIMIPYFMEDKKNVLLTSDGIRISLWDMSKDKLLSSYYFASGNIYDLAVSTINPNLMAVSTGDGFLKIWNVGSEATKIEMSSILTNYRVKIMCVAWHPVEEHIIAYGSDEGRVGITDIYKKKTLYSYETHHSSAVYSIYWAPCCKLKDSQEEYFLYSCGGGCIYIYELNKPKIKPVDFDTLITLPPDFNMGLKSHSEMCWNSDYSCLAVGNLKGCVVLFDNKLNFLTQFTLQMKNVETLKWHPKYTFTSPSGSKYSSWLAAAGYNEDIHIIDSSDVIIEGESSAILCKSTRTLVGHKKRIFSICWSPHNDGYLASASRDGTVQVWNAVTVHCVAIYPWHRDIVLSVQWSIFDPDIIYSGGMDNCLRIWKVSEQTLSALPEKFQLAKHKSCKIKAKSSDIIEFKSETKISSQSETLQNEPAEEPKAHFSEELCHFRKDIKSLFSGHLNMLHKEKNLEDIFKLTDILCCHSDSSISKNMLPITEEESLNFGLYTDQFTAVKMLETKAKSVDGDTATYFQLIACNIVPLLTTAAEKKQLTDFHIACAPKVSYAFWHEMCEKYAIQLVEERRYVKASMYLLSCGKIYDAVKVLMENEKLLDALALAKARLPEDDPLISTILQKVCYFSSKNRMILNEVACYLALKEPLQAAKVLYCTANSKHIYASTYICSKFNLKEEAETYGYLCMEKCLSQYDWPTFHKVAELVESLKVYKVLVRVHELISTNMKELKRKGDDKIFGLTGSKLLIWEGKIFEKSDLSFLAHIYSIIKTEGILPEDRESLQEIHKTLNLMDEKRKKYEVSTEAHVAVAIYTTQIIITSLLDDLCLATKYFIKNFVAVYNIAFMPKVVCCLFLPLDLYWYSYEDAFFCKSKNKDTEILPFTFHFQDIYTSVCNKFASIGKSDNGNFIVIQDILSNLNVIIQHVSTVLSKKTTEDSVLLYFSAFYLNKLRKQAKDGWKFRCYNNVTECGKPSEGIVHANESLSSRYDTSVEKISPSVQYVPEQTEVAEESVIENKSQNVTKEQTEVEEKSVIENKSQNGTKEQSEVAEESVIENKSQNGTKEQTEVEEKSVIENKSQNGTKEQSEVAEESVIENKSQNTNPTSVISGVATQAVEHGSHYPPGDEEIEETLSSMNINGKNRESNTLIISDNHKIEENEANISENDDDDHAQCWTDISLYYVLTKCFISVVCKDEYAVLFYLRKYLCHLDRTIADLTRQQSTKSVLKSSETNELCANRDCNNICNISKNKLSLDSKEIPQKSSILQDFVDSNILNSEEVVDSVEENKNDTKDILSNSILENKVSTNGVDQNKIQDGVTINNDNDDDNMKLENENSIENGGNDNSDATSINTAEEKYEFNDCSSSIKISKTGFNDKEVSSKQLQAEHENISEQIKLLNSKEFCYPNPFDAVTTTNEICCDIFHKNPCKLIKEKFHELAHEVKKWSAKFCVADETILCAICHKKICA